MQGETTTASVQPKPQHSHHFPVLFPHVGHPHQPRNVNEVHKAELRAGGINTAIAISLTKHVGSMWTAYIFVVLAIIGLLAILGLLNPIVALLVAWTSQTFIQLVLLPVIMVGQNVLGRKAELQADEQFNTTMKTYHDIEQIIQHLAAQDAEILRQTRMLVHLLQHAGLNPEQLPDLRSQSNGGAIAAPEVQAQG